MVDLNKQNNFHKLNNNVLTSDSRLVKQKSKEWLNIRQQAIATGSTCNSALELGQLKQQQTHNDKVFLGKECNASVQGDQRRNMKYWVEHEIDGIATMVPRVIPHYSLT